MQKTSVVVFGILAAAAISLFQNCSPVGFDGSGKSSEASLGAGTSKSAVLNVNTSQTMAPFKLLIVVDNSNTMSQLQAKLSQNVGPMLARLQGRDVEVKIITTSDNASGSTGYMSLDFSHLLTDTADSDPSVPGYILLRNFAPPINSAGITRFSLIGTDSASVWQQKLTAIQSRILALGTDGSDTETSVCPLARELVDADSANSFFKAGDSAAVVVLSDEDDQSSLSSCHLRESNTRMGPIVTQTQQSFSVAGLSLELQYQVNLQIRRDNVTSQLSYIYKVRNPKSSVRFNDQVPGVCSPSMISRIESSSMKAYVSNEVLSGTGYTVVSADVQSINECSITAGRSISHDTAEQLSLPSGTDLCSFRSNSGQIFGFNSYLDFMNAYSGMEVTGACQASLSSWEGRKNIGGAMPADLPVLAASDNEQLADRTIQKAQTLFNGKVMISFITEPTDNSCTLGAGEGRGIRYARLANAFPSVIQTYPICSSSYLPALDRVGNFAVSNATRVFQMPTDVVHLVRVTVVRGSQTIALNITEFTVSGHELRVQRELIAGDQLRLDYN
jgi:hypothetical protein